MSKSCCCSDKKRDMPTWKCAMEWDCGNVLDGDRNGTIGIMIRYLSPNALWGYQLFAGILRKTGIINNQGYLGILSNVCTRKRSPWIFS